MHPEETKLYIIVLVGIFVLSVLMAAYIVVIAQYHKRKKMLYVQRIKADINFLEKERARIAADLHDDFGASLSAIKLKLQCLEPDTLNENRLIEEAELYIDDAMKKLRRISLSLMPSILQTTGLNEAINELVYIVSQSGKIEVNYHCDVSIPDQEKRVHVYRMIQEIMNNVIKHSKATTLEIKIVRKKQGIIIDIRDNGVGFDKTKFVKHNSGLGLQNIVSRSELLKADLRLLTCPGCGVNYIIEISDISGK